MIKRVKIKNFKGLQETEIEFQDGLNIIVGDNEVGKSTVLEAINLALTGQINRRSASYELHPFLFNARTAKSFIAALQDGEKTIPPEIEIEVYFQDEVGNDFKGTNNSRNEDCSGVCLKIVLDENFTEEYEAFIGDTEKAAMIPTDYYRIDWISFSGDPMNLRSAPVKPILIDPGAISNSYAANKYVVEIARDFLSQTEQASVAISYRHMRKLFQDDENIRAINEHLSDNASEVSERTLSIGLDMTAKASWETGVQPHLDGLPLNQIGKGEQNSIKIKLALKAGEDHPVVLLEEPENHLSHTNLNRLIGYISDHVGDRQVIATTHNSFVLNKLGVENTLLFNGESAIRISNLTEGTCDYFKKLPGHDTLRMVLAKRTILVEGPSDELIVLKAYQEAHGRAPLEDGVEIITVNSLAFKRFLEIAKELKIPVSVVTDNDGDPDAVKAKYADFSDAQTISICYSEDADLSTLEPQLVASIGRELLNEIFGKSFNSDDQLLEYMKNNKTKIALQLLETDQELSMPEYINNAVKE